MLPSMAGLTEPEHLTNLLLPIQIPAQQVVIQLSDLLTVHKMIL